MYFSKYSLVFPLKRNVSSYSIVINRHHTSAMYIGQWSVVKSNECHFWAWALRAVPPSLLFFFFKFIFYFLVFCLFRATPVAYGSSQARGPIGAIAASLSHSHGNTGSLTHCARSRGWTHNLMVPSQIRFHYTMTGTPLLFLSTMSSI